MNDVLRVLDARNANVRREDAVLAVSVGEYYQQPLADSLALYGDLVRELLAGKHPECAIDRCKRTAAVAVAAATSSGRAFVCEPHGTGELPLEPARIPKVLDVPPAMVPIPPHESVVMSMPRIGQAGVHHTPMSMEMSSAIGHTGPLYDATPRDSGRGAADRSPLLRRPRSRRPGSNPDPRILPGALPTADTAAGRRPVRARAESDRSPRPRRWRAGR